MNQTNQFSRTGVIKIDGSRKLHETKCTVCGNLRWIRSYEIPKRCPKCRNETDNLIIRIKNRTIFNGEKGCHLWKGYFSKDGYALIKHKGQKYKVARYLLETVLKRKLLPGMETCHDCNNRGCINPEHVYEGTHAQNGIDMANSNILKGEKCASHKINRETAKTIKILLKNGNSITQIVKDLNISKNIVKNIKYQRSWVWLTIDMDE